MRNNDTKKGNDSKESYDIYLSKFCATSSRLFCSFVFNLNTNIVKFIFRQVQNFHFYFCMKLYWCFVCHQGRIIEIGNQINIVQRY